jgi:hypothetical protein
VAALSHSSPPTCERLSTTDSLGSRILVWKNVLWKSEDLLRIAAVSKDLRAATTADHLWEPLLEQLMQQHPFRWKEWQDVAFPRRLHDKRGDSCHPHSRDRTARGHVPALVLCTHKARYETRFDEGTGAVSDLFIPAPKEQEEERENQQSWPRSPQPYDVWLPRPPVLMRCEPCGGLSFECGGSFKEHCSSWTHSQMMLPPEERLPKELWDPRCDPQAFAALTLPGRYCALRLHVDTVMAAFNEPLDEAGMENMQSHVGLQEERFRGIQ